MIVGAGEPFKSLSQMIDDDEPLETLEETLVQTIQLVIRAVGCDAASLSLSENGKIRTIQATDPSVIEADRAQYESGRGPCVQAATKGEIFEIPDMLQDHRWEEFSSASLELGWHSSLSVPIKVETRSIGALNLYDRSSQAFGEEKRRIASLFASRAAISLAQAELIKKNKELVAQLETALRSRDLIGQAKGILMERENIGADEAFGMLVTASQHSNRKLRDVAEDLVRSTEHTESSE
jgi:GAF domain-containing protein